MVPDFGPYYDQHVVVDRSEDEPNLFILFAPDRIDRRPVRSAWLAYYPEPFDGEPKSPVHYDEIRLESDGGLVFGEFRLTKDTSDLYAAVRVIYDGLCDATAHVIVDASLGRDDEK